MRVSRTRFAKRRLRKKTSFPVVAIIQKKTRPQYKVSDWSDSKRSLIFLNKAKDIKEENPNVLRNRAIRSIPPKKSRATVDYKNVVLLRKLITAEGKILPRRINKLTAKQQRSTAKAIKSARVMGLLPFINKSRPLA